MKKIYLVIFIIMLSALSFSALIELLNGSKASVEVLSVNAQGVLINSDFGQNLVAKEKIKYVLFDETKTFLTDKKGIMLSNGMNVSGEIQELKNTGGIIKLKYGIIKLLSMSSVDFINYEFTDSEDYFEEYKNEESFSIAYTDSEKTEINFKNNFSFSSENILIDEKSVTITDEIGTLVFDKFMIYSVLLNKSYIDEGYDSKFILKNGIETIGKILSFSNGSYIIESPLKNKIVIEKEKIQSIIYLEGNEKTESEKTTSVNINGKILNGLLKLDSKDNGEFLFISNKSLPEINGIKLNMIRFTENKENEIVDPRTGITFVHIPAGSFIMGSNKDWENYGSSELPMREVYLDGYYISKYPITVKQYSDFLRKTANGVNCSEGIYLEKDETTFQGKKFVFNYRPKAEYGNYIENNISWKSAIYFSDYAGYSLPTEAQWEKAARGSDGRRYPWGNNKLDNKLFNSSVINILYNQFEKSDISPYGVVNMAGYPSEWCLDDYSDNFYSKSPKNNPVNLTNSSYKIIRVGTDRISYRRQDIYSFLYSFRVTIPEDKIEEVIKSELKTMDFGAYLFEINEEIKISKKLPESTGLVIVGIINGSPAESSGLQINDIIIEQDLKKIEKKSDLIFERGKTSNLKINRNGKIMNIIVKAGEWTY